MGSALDRVRTAQVENEALKVSAKETPAALQETTAELKDLKGELKWLQLHIASHSRPRCARKRRWRSWRPATMCIRTLITTWKTKARQQVLAGAKAVLVKTGYGASQMTHPPADAVGWVLRPRPVVS